MQRHRFGPSLSLQIEGIFPLELTWVLTPFPKTLSAESINQGLVCVHIPLHRLKTSWHSCPRQVNAGNKNTPSHHPRRRNMTTSVVRLKYTVAKISPKMVIPRDITRNAEEKKKKNARGSGDVSLTDIGLVHKNWNLHKNESSCEQEIQKVWILLSHRIKLVISAVVWFGARQLPLCIHYCHKELNCFVYDKPFLPLEFYFLSHSWYHCWKG